MGEHFDSEARQSDKRLIQAKARIQHIQNISKNDQLTSRVLMPPTRACYHICSFYDRRHSRPPQGYLRRESRHQSVGESVSAVLPPCGYQMGPDDVRCTENGTRFWAHVCLFARNVVFNERVRFVRPSGYRTDKNKPALRFRKSRLGLDQTFSVTLDRGDGQARPVT